MYYPNIIEDICYDSDHIEQVLTEIKLNFHDYFSDFLQSEAGNGLSDDYVVNLVKHFGNDSQGQVIKKRKKDTKKAFQQIIKESIEGYEKDREKYLDIFDEDVFDEYEDDPNYFKNKVLRDECPIIRVTIYSNAKELEKYKRDFNLADPNDLLDVVMNLTSFANTYSQNQNSSNYELIDSLEELGFQDLDTGDYIVYGAIGGGIKSHLLYKLQPAYFPNRSRDAIWALWYLSKKKTFGCLEDSEFLMINVKESITQQNYFYPYELFSYYALKIFQLIEREAMNLNIQLNKDYRFVLVNEFLSYVASVHSDEINFLKSQLKEANHGF
ncbi:hypothetical protein CUC15_05715 [Oceanobacillus zhaokaii]|uniref:Uncharacterized protein n=1 Tax=Oceanobacillus zhaokaii TaxID=2052660 RepID=A0A345PEL4_9BACI|nr:hypothetical protein [Oceanobacillus zhaokaii]AXI08444.1 hypothetical protein CUC15_05715 [Oceanobacillus zhaokaii]